MKPSEQAQIRTYYRTLHHAWGPQHWWPARTRFEVIVGAYLVQNTAWTNVEPVLRRLRTAGLLTVAGIRSVPLRQLQSIIRPTGYFRQKSQSIKTFVGYVDRQHGGSLHRMFAQPTEKLREQLLALNGVGPETADSILLYAGQRPVFVVDAYTRRVLERHGILPAHARYEEVRQFCERALAGVTPAPATRATRTRQLETPQLTAHRPSPMSLAKRSALAQVYNQMHGLLVAVGKHYCLKSAPRCDQCPLRCFLPKPARSHDLSAYN